MRDRQLMTGVLAAMLVVGLLTCGRASEADAVRATGDAQSVTSFGSVADSEWTLAVEGLVRSPLNLTLDDLLAMPATTVHAPLYCVGLPTIPLVEGDWTGVRLRLVLDEAGYSPRAVKVAFYANAYTTDLTVTVGQA